MKAISQNGGYELRLRTHLLVHLPVPEGPLVFSLSLDLSNGAQNAGVTVEQVPHFLFLPRSTTLVT